jgi:putative endonuclease
MASDPRRDLGASGEQFAAEHLRRCGYEIVARNYRTRYGELDIVAFDGRALVFCEVKTRRADGRCGSPFEALGPGKRAQVRRMAARWLSETRDRPHAEQIRFDAVGVTLDRRGQLLALEHLEGAF